MLQYLQLLLLKLCLDNDVLRDLLFNVLSSNIEKDRFVFTIVRSALLV